MEAGCRTGSDLARLASIEGARHQNSVDRATPWYRHFRSALSTTSHGTPALRSQLLAESLLSPPRVLQIVNVGSKVGVS